LKATYEALIGNTKVDLLNGQSVNALVASVVGQTYSQLAKEYGEDATQWQLALYPRLFRYQNFMGIPQNHESGRPSTALEQNRGTENNMSVFYSDRIEGFEVAPPGQSGFIAPDGTPSPHMFDQMDLYENFGKKRMWFYPEDVMRQAKTEIILNIVK
jgi:penicillin amidase